MKYIRTKDGIWLFGGTHAKGKVIIGKKQEMDFGYCFDKKDIIKQADTIEELCDEFLLRYKNENNEYLIDRVDRLGCGITREELDKHDYSITQQGIKYTGALFGAIWTDKGLIYVAKLNDKGEWELL